jgi:hypothetical protein
MKTHTILLIILLMLLIFYKVVDRNKLIDKFEISGINNVDVIYFINLDHRVDRLYDFLTEMKKVNYPFNKIIRIPGVYKQNQGHLGCSLSHIKALEHFISSEYKTCIVFEDDFEFTKSNDEINQAFDNLFNNNVDFDVCMISSNTVYQQDTKYPFLKKVDSTQTTSGYMVSQQFAYTLLKNYKKGASLLKDSYDKNDFKDEYCIDQYWKLLQPESKWFVFEPKLGKQRSSHSDIMNGFVNMDVFSNIG